MNIDFTLLLSGMRDDFLGELPERCDILEELVLTYKHGVTNTFDQIFRHIHSLKGSGGTFGVPIITRICHQFESCY